MANILILGGTGAMGVHLVNLLNRNNGHCVTVTSRQRHKNFGNIMFVEGDAHEPSFLSRADALLNKLKIKLSLKNLSDTSYLNSFFLYFCPIYSS